MRGERTAIWKKKYCLNSHSSNSSEKVLLIARALSYSVFLLHARSNLSRKSWHSKRTEWTYTLIKKKHKNKKRRMFVSTLCASNNNNNQKSPESSILAHCSALACALNSAVFHSFNISSMCIHIFPTRATTENLQLHTHAHSMARYIGATHIQQQKTEKKHASRWSFSNQSWFSATHTCTV